jgi:replicative DNA helicase
VDIHINNLEAEQAVLGTIIINNDYLIKVYDFLKAEHFYGTAHQELYKYILKTLDSEQVANQITLKQFFETELQELGTGYISTLLASASVIVDIADYAKVIIDCWKRRELVEKLKDLLEMIPNPKNSFNQISESLTKTIENLELETQEQPQTLQKVVQETIEGLVNKTNSEVISTGFDNLNEVLGGFNEGYLVILAGRPAMGKSTLAVCLAKEIAKNHHILFISLEMSAKQIASKVLCNLTSVNLKSIKNNTISEDDLTRLINSQNETNQLKFNLDYPKKGLGIKSLRVKIKRSVQKFKTKVVVIDYLGKIKLGEKSWSKNDEISQITNALKDIATEFGIVIICLSQLSRAVEIRQDKRPQLSDLRDSGSIEQDADVVLFCYRAEYYLHQCKPNQNVEPTQYREWLDKLNQVRGLAEVIVAKAREAEPRTTLFHFDGEFGRFIEKESEVI